MTIWLHLGMPKTGSSSIQDTLFNLDTNDVSYLPWVSPNHGGLLALLFEDEPLSFPGFSNDVFNAQKIGEMRRAKLAEIEKYLIRHVGNKIICSAERGFHYSAELKGRLFDFFSSFTDDLRIIVYIRPPISYLQSSFQQNLKEGRGSYRVSEIWPEYRRKLECLDKIFGGEKVSLVPFDQNTMHNGDVLQDFLHRVVISVPESKMQRSNESLSLEAISLFYFMRTTDPDPLRKLPPQALRRLTADMATIGVERLTFSEKMIRPVIQENMADIEWLEHRLGKSILDESSCDDTAIDREEDLLLIAARQSRELGKVFRSAVERASLESDSKTNRVFEALSLVYQ